MMMRQLVLMLAIATTVLCQTSQDDFVQFNVPFYTHDWYSGYLNISYKDIHYVYLESQNDRDNDPLVLWVAGGPGCSGIYSMLYEIGAFRFLKPETTLLNVSEGAWNKKANLLFFEAPGGVGFSKGPVNATDASTVDDLLFSLLEFYARFPTQKKNDLYLAGHGYAGILVPKLAKLIHERNQQSHFMKMNLKGILLGNPCTDPRECYASGSNKQSYYHYEYLYNHAFMTDQHWNQFRGICTLNYNSAECFNVRQQLDKLFDSTNSSMYNIYAKCYKNTNSTENIVNLSCDDQTGILNLLNDPMFQNTIHVTPGNWSVCNMDIFKAYIGDNEGSYPIYSFLLKQKKYNIFIYSGDLDSTIPIIGTKEWISKLREEIDIPIRRTWREWWVPGKHPHEDQVGGMVWELEGLTFASVKGAGFTIGREKPVALYEIFDAFISNKRLPLTSSAGRRSNEQEEQMEL